VPGRAPAAGARRVILISAYGGARAFGPFRAALGDHFYTELCPTAPGGNWIAALAVSPTARLTASITDVLTGRPQRRLVR
jgi:hypothetical protein